ncbi:MAG TPA: molybdopterin-dependent oxidoreductase, partial [Acidimicrobiales bacterium]|nr:molybdopterin-dependent oxidoreductase [Acidimicrobiales bacterium]
MTTRRWVRVCSVRELEPGRGVAALVDGRQVAVFVLPGLPGASGLPDAREPAVRLRAIDNHDPATGANVLSRGLLGSTGDVEYVASPMRKHRYDLDSGRCLDGSGSVPGVRVWPVRSWGGTVEVLSVVGEAAEAVRTHCPFCALQCGMRVRGSGAGVAIESDPSFPVNEGRMCVKGWASAGLIGHPDRLTSPLLRDAGGVLQPVGWDEALSYVADRIVSLQSSSGRDSVGVFGSGALTNEKAYLLGKFARVALGTANIDYNGRFCMSSAAAAQNRAFGVDRGLPFPIADVARTGGLVLWGSNPADTMPPLMEWIQRMQSGGGTFAVVDPRRTATAEMADLHVQPVPGTDLAVALGLLHLADARGLVDVSYVATRTTGWSSVLDAVEDWTPERVEEVSGVAPGLLDRLLDVLAGPPSSMLISGRGPEQQSKGVDTVTALINLMLALGRVGRPASGYGCLTGQANGQGGREHGQKADQLPGYRSIADPADRAAVAGVWGVDPSDLPGPGLSATEMVDSIGRPGGVRGLLVFGSDLATASPSACRTTSQLGRLDLLVVADSMMSATAAAADVVLPVAQWA